MKPTDRVLTLGFKGQWLPATVIEVSETFTQVRVRRDDGSERIVPLTHIRTSVPSEGIALEAEFEYRGHMPEDIVIPVQSVVIPSTSQAYRIEKATEPITELMNQTPLRVNYATWERNMQAQDQKTVDLALICAKEVGDAGFKPNSSAQCIKVLSARGHSFTRMTQSGGKGQLSCDIEVLEGMQRSGDTLIGDIINARKAISEQSQLKKWVEFAKQGYAQTTWDQYGSPAARYTAAAPALLNRITQIRETVEPDPGWSFVSNDLSQAEYRTWASLSKATGWIADFNLQKDFHQERADAILAQLPNLDLHGETPRQFGKMVNFAMTYLATAPFLAGKLGVDNLTAGRILAAWKVDSQGGWKYVEDYLTECRATGQSRTHFGRVRELPILRSTKKGELHDVEKTAWHHHNSGTAAEILKIKTVRTVAALTRANLYPHFAKVAINFYDELILMVKDEYLKEVSDIFTEQFQRPIPDFIDFPTTQKTGKNWLEVSK